MKNQWSIMQAVL